MSSPSASRRGSTRSHVSSRGSSARDQNTNSAATGRSQDANNNTSQTAEEIRKAKEQAALERKYKMPEFKKRDKGSERVAPETEMYRETKLKFSQVSHSSHISHR